VWTATCRLRARPNRVALVALAILASCTSSPGATGGSPPRPTLVTSPHSPTPSVSLPIVSADLEAPPSGCPGPSRRPRTVSPAYGTVIGGGPLWGGFYALFDAKANTFHASEASRTELGWVIKVLWLVKPGQTQEVTVEGADASTGEHLWFEIADQVASTEPHLDPSHPAAHSDGDWNEFPSYLYFPRAACYRLMARWPDGSWTFGFGFGR
jgi:hypothetical protein